MEKKDFESTNQNFENIALEHAFEEEFHYDLTSIGIRGFNLTFINDSCFAYSNDFFCPLTLDMVLPRSEKEMLVNFVDIEGTSYYFPITTEQYRILSELFCNHLQSSTNLIELFIT